MAMAHEFSFPNVVTDQAPFTTPFQSYLLSPEHEYITNLLRRSISQCGIINNIASLKTRSLTPNSPIVSDFGEDEYEERMDMLWEDFNDDLPRISYDSREYLEQLIDLKAFDNFPRRRSLGLEAFTFENSLLNKKVAEVDEVIQFKQLNVLKSKRRKPTLMVMLKTLKKFVARRTQQSKRELKQRR